MIREAEKAPFPFHTDHIINNVGAASGSRTLSDAMAERAIDAADLKRRVLNFLASRNRPGLRQLEVQVDGGVVVLSGRVRSYYDKQLASSCCGRVAGVLRVVDGICVIPEPSEIAVG